VRFEGAKESVPSGDNDSSDASRDGFAFGLFGVICALRWSLPASSGADLYWHLAAGRKIVELGQVPQRDWFSYSRPHGRWVNHEWLWDVFAWSLYRVDHDLVAWVNLAIIALTLTGTFLLCHRVSRSAPASCVALWTAAAGMHWFFEVRPHVASFLLFGSFLVTVELRRGLWAWPLIILVWANLHASFVLGLGAAGLYILVRAVELKRERSGLRRLIGPCCSLLVSCAVAWATPFGSAVWDFLLSYSPGNAGPYTKLLEWQAPGLGLDKLTSQGPLAWAWSFHGRFWLTAVLWAVGVSIVGRKGAYWVALSLLMLAMATSARRFIPLFMMTSAPLVAVALREAAARAGAMARRPDRFRHVWVYLVGVLAMCIAWYDVKLTPRLLARWTQEDLFPQAAVLYLASFGPPRRVFNEYELGGYIAFKLPQSRVFIDGRANTIYDASLAMDYLRSVASPRGVNDVLARYPADAALVRSHGRLERNLMALPSPWHLVYQDPFASVLLPPDSASLARGLPDPEVVLAREPQYRVEVARRRAQRGEPRAALRALDELLKREPLLVEGHALRASILAAVSGPAAAEQAFAAGMRAYPSRREEYWHLQGELFLRLGDRTRGLRALERGTRGDPFAESAVRRTDR